MRLSRVLRWAQQDGKNWLMRVFYYTYIPLILYFGIRTMNLSGLLAQMQQKQ